jgi:hypothetical protein
VSEEKSGMAEGEGLLSREQGLLTSGSEGWAAFGGRLDCDGRRKAECRWSGRRREGVDGREMRISGGSGGAEAFGRRLRRPWGDGSEVERRSVASLLELDSASKTGSRSNYGRRYRMMLDMFIPISY